MKSFVFICKSDEGYSLGLLSDDAQLDGMVILNNLDAKGVKSAIDMIPTECVFVGKNLRQGVLSELHHELCRNKLELPEKLKFHWVPPYKLPIDDIDWLFNYGSFSETPIPMDSMAKELGLTLSGDSNHKVKDLASIYFTLTGDFIKFTPTSEVPF